MAVSEESVIIQVGASSTGCVRSLASTSAVERQQ